MKPIKQHIACLLLLLLLLNKNGFTACTGISAGISSNTTSICGSGLVTITNLTTGSNSGTADYSWYVGSTLLQTTTGLATNTYSIFLSTSFTYNFNIIAHDNVLNCYDTAYVTVIVHPTIVANISGDDGDGDTQLCLVPGDTVTHDNVLFSNTTSGASSYAWNFGDGSTLTTASLTGFNHNYPNFGTYHVTMIASNAGGCTQTDSLLVSFEKYYSASFTVPPSQVFGCTPLLVTPTNTSTSTYTFVWNFGDGTSTTTTNYTAPTHTYTTPGAYTISLTASNACGSISSTTGPINVVNGPDAIFTTNLTNDLGCAPQTVSFTNSSLYVSPSNNYNWTFGNGNVANNVKNPPPQTYHAGTYTIRLIAGSNCGKDTVYRTITIDTIPTARFTATPISACSPQVVSLTNLATGGALTYKWYVDGVLTNSTATYAGLTFTNTTAVNQTHTIKLEVTNHCGTDDTTITFTTNPALDAKFNPTVLSYCSGANVTFTNTSTGLGITSYSWNFGNGQTANTVGPHIINYTTVGTVQVKLVVTGSCGSDSLTKTLTIKANPTAQIAGSDTTIICLGNTLNYTNVSSTIAGTTYAWAFASGTPATSAILTPPPITYNTLGTFNTILTVTQVGCVRKDTVKVIVKPIPQVNFTASPLSGCSPVVTSFTNTSVVNTGDVFIWDFGNGNTYAGLSPPASQTYTSANDTVVNIKLVLSSGGTCADSITQQVTIHPLPVASFLPSTDTVCGSASILFLNNSAGGTVFNWNFDDGTTSTATLPSHIYNSYNTFNVQLNVTSPYGCKDSTVSQIYTAPKPKSDFSFSNLCEGDSVVFNDITSDSPTQWLWDFGDGSATDTSQNPAHVYPGAGAYFVSLTTNNNSGCDAFKTKIVTIKPKPIANFGTSTACETQSTQFIDSTGFGISSYFWNFGDGDTANIRNPLHTYPTQGTYTTKFTVVGNNGCMDTISRTVNVNPLPIVGFIADTVCKGTQSGINNLTTGAVNYNWNFGDGGTSTLQTPSHLYSNSNTYTITLIAESTVGCKDTLSKTTFVRASPIADFTSDSVCLQSTTTFADLSPAAIAWQWNYGDGSAVDTIQNVNHNYSSSGNHTVTLIASFNQGCVDTVAHTIYVKTKPIANFYVNGFCNNKTISLLDSSGTGNISYSWDLGDGSALINTANTQHIYTSTGTYNVVHIVNNAEGCSDTIVKPVNVLQSPVANFITDTVCLGNQTTLTNQSLNANSYYWFLGYSLYADSTLNTAFTYPIAGTYNPYLIAYSNNGCSDTIQGSVLVNAKPVIDFSLNNACVGNSVTITDLSANTSNWTWTTGDGNNYTGVSTFNHNYGAAGAYQITLNATFLNGCIDSLSKTVNVFQNPIAGFTTANACLNNVVVFNDSVANSGSTINWDFGDGNTLSGTNNITDHIYNTVNAYNVIKIVTDANGCKDTATAVVTINPLPIPDFTTDSMCLGEANIFTDASTSVNAITTYLWQFGDGNTSATQSPVYIYQAPGNYNASLTITDANGCDSTITKNVNVKPTPTAMFTADTVCLGLATTFTDVLNVPNSTWFWNFGDGDTSVAGPTTTHSYGASGNFLASLIVKSGSLCQAATFKYVTVFDVANVAFTLSAPRCENTSITFTDNSIALGMNTITGYEWQFGDGDSSLVKDTLHTYSGTGNYIVQLTVSTTNGCKSFESDTITINPLPQPNFTFANACETQAVQFTDSSISTNTITNWDWNFGDGLTAQSQNTSHVYAAGTNFSVALTITDINGCVASISKPIVLHAVPVADFSFTPSCWNDQTLFVNNSTIANGSIVNYDWNFGDGSVDSVATPNHHFQVFADNFIVTLIAESDFGCKDTLQKPVNTLPIANINFGASNASGCLPYTASFTDNSTVTQNSSLVYWFWDFGDANYSYQTNPQHLYNSIGTYPIILSVTTAEGCVFNDTLSYPVIVHPQAVADFSAIPQQTNIFQPMIEFVDQSSNTTIWNWNISDLEQSTLQNPSYTFPDSGTYTITLIASNQFGCADTITKDVRVDGVFTFYIPNAFTPNKDDNNDTFKGYGYGIKEFNMKIFNRWGELEFQTNDVNEGWKGKEDHQKLQKVDSYIYKIYILDINGEEHNIKGEFILIR